MIIKGSSRAAPSQLGRHLARADTNERVRILELQSPASSPTEAFEDWQTLAEGTRGHKGLYHANIDPAAKYQMTEEQWFRAVDVLEEELGFKGQPRAVVMHEKHGREHIHVVWQRTDIDTMTLRNDGHNYQAHERASLRLEQEFGHELVPGKHAKRDRDAQPEMPSAEIHHDEWQQAERGEFDHRARKEQVKGLFEATDNGPAFKAALEDAGYVLARGDRRDFVILDADAKVHSLGRQLPGISAKELRAFMVEVNPALLSSVAEARDKLRAKAHKQDVEKPEPEFSPAPDLSAPTPEEEARLAAMLDALADRHVIQREELSKRFSAEITELQKQQEAEASRLFDEHAREAARRLTEDKPPEPGAMERLWRTVREAISEEAHAQRQAEEVQRRVSIDAHSQQEIRNMVAGLEFKQRVETERLGDRQSKEKTELYSLQANERDRRIADEERARTLAREYAQRERDGQDRARDGPDRGGGRAR